MHIHPYAPRRFVPEHVDLTDTAQLAPLFDLLEARLAAVSSVAELEEWLSDHGELNAALGESSALTYIAMTCQTDDAEREKAYLHIIEVVDPWLKPRQFVLTERVVATPWFQELPEFYQVFQRSAKEQVKIYREENVAREMQVAKRTNQYQKITGAMTVHFEGKEQTIPALGRILEEPDRPRRQAAWEATAARRLQDAQKLDDLFDELLQIRHEIALAAGFPDFRAYTFANCERFDYTPQDCLDFHTAVEKQIVPMARALQLDRKEKLRVEPLRPWDLAVDPEHRPPLHPFQNSQELMDKSHAIFSELDPRLADYFQILRQQELVDLDNRKGKAPGGYQSTLSESRVPFIFMNSVGAHRDVETLLHEAGHAFHALAARDLPLQSYRHAPIEFCEVASMSMELLAAPHLTHFYSEADTHRAQREHLKGIIKFFPWMATIDAFQHWIYTHPKHTQTERRDYWLSLLARFGGLEDYSGYEDTRASQWHSQLHLFEVPFYYVEYGIAQLGALQIWRTAALEGTVAAIEYYLRGLRLGGSRPLPELFSAAGIQFDFTEKTIAPLMQAVKDALQD